MTHSIDLNKIDEMIAEHQKFDYTPDRLEIADMYMRLHMTGDERVEIARHHGGSELQVVRAMVAEVADMIDAARAGQVSAEQVKSNVKFTYFWTATTREKLTAAEQRSLFFGHYLFGRKDLLCTPEGVSTLKRVAYGADYDSQFYTWQQIAHMINNNLKAGNSGTMTKA